MTNHRFPILLFLFMALSVFAKGKKDVSPLEDEALFEEPVESEENTAVDLNVAVQTDLSTLPAAFLMEHTPNINGKTISYESISSPSILLQRLMRGQAQIGFLPPAASAKVFTKYNGALVALGVCQKNSSFLMGTDPSYKGFESLKGKKVYLSASDFVTKKSFALILEKNGLKTVDFSSSDGEEKESTDSESVMFDYSIPPSQIPSALISGKIQYAVLAEPYASVAQKRGSSVSRLESLENLSDVKDIPQMLMVTSQKFASENGELVASFIEEYKKALDWTRENPLKAGILAKKHMGLSSSLVQASLERGGLVWTEGDSAKTQLEGLFNWYLADSPQSMGESLPEDGFYWKN